MYQKILAPLDGSKLSEHSLKHIRAIATRCQVPEVVWLRVVEPVSTMYCVSYMQAGARCYPFCGVLNWIKVSLEGSLLELSKRVSQYKPVIRWKRG